LAVSQWEKLSELENSEYEKFLQENQAKVSKWINPKINDLNLEKIRRHFECEKKGQIYKVHTLIPVLTYYFPGHCHQAKFLSAHAPKTKGGSSVLRKRGTGNDIPLVVSRDLEEAESWAISYLTQHQPELPWRFALASNEESWTLFGLRNGKERMRKNFPVSSIDNKEHFIFENLIKNLIMVMGFDAPNEKPCP